MKKQIEMLLACVVILFMATLASCTDSIDDDIITDDEYVTFALVDFNDYEMDYGVYVDGTGEWKEIFPGDYDSFGLVMPRNFVTFGNQAWQSVLEIWVYKPLSIDYLWRKYCADTGYDKTIYTPFRFEFDEQENILRVRNMDVDVLSISRHDVTLHCMSEGVASENIIVKKFKHILFYRREKTKKSDLKKSIFYDSEKSALLDIIAKMRQYYGDELVEGNKVYNFVEMERDVLTDNHYAAF